MFKKVANPRCIGLVAAAITATVLSGCAASSGAPGASGETKIGYVQSAQDTSFFGAISSGMDKAVTASGAKLTTTSADRDPAKQANDVNTLVTSGAKGVLIDPLNADAIVPAIDRAAAAGTKVVIIDGVASASKGIAIQVTTDNYKAGAEGCKVIGDLLNNKGTVLNLQGDLGATAAIDRSNGFTDCMSKSYPGITVVSKSYNWDSAQCLKVAQTQMSSTQIDGVFSAGQHCVSPVTSVLTGQGRVVKSGQPGHVPFVAIDGDPDELDALRAGTLSAVISQPAKELGERGVYWLMRAIKGEKIAEGPTDNGTEVVTIDGTLRELLPPVVVTSKNVDDPSLWGNSK